MNYRDRKLEYESVVHPIIRYLNSISGSKAINIHGSIFSERGTPDIIGSVHGRTIVFECKRDRIEDLEPIQKWRLCEWIKAGAVAGGVSEVWHVQYILQLMGVI